MSVKSDLQKLMSRGKSISNIEEPWWMPEYRTGKSLSSLTGAISAGYDKAKERGKNAVISGVNLLPKLAGLIRNEDDLTNYENMSAELTRKAGRHTETAPYAPFISGVADNLREDYEMYTKTMESGAKFIDDPNFIIDMQGWDDLENTVAGMTKEDGTTPKYQGNGTSLFLTEQNNAINSLIGRIKNSSKGTQFRYNKAGNKYTDAEMIKNLEDYQARLGIALEASLGDGIITKEEAESIMLGDLSAYQKRKSTALKRVNSHYNKLDSYHQKLLKDIRTIELKPSGFDFSGLIRDVEIENSLIMDKEDKYDDGSPIEGLNIDTSLSSTSKEDIIKQMQDQIATINLLKQGYKKSHVAWSGESFRPKVTVSKEEKDKLLGNIMIPKITGAFDSGQAVELDKIDLDVKGNKWAYDPPTSHREDYEKGYMSDDPNSPIYAIDEVYQYPELFEKKKKDDEYTQGIGTVIGGKKKEEYIAGYGTSSDIKDTIMEMIAPYKKKLVAVASPEMRKKAMSRAVKKYPSTMNKAIVKVEARRKKELEDKEFLFYPSQDAKKKNIKKINKKYDTQVQQIRSKYLSPKEAVAYKTDWVKPATVDELFNEMDIFDKILKHKIDFKFLGMSNDDERLLMKHLREYKKHK